jgi:hypothetical protein
MKRLVSVLTIAVFAALWLPGVASADFGLNSFDVTFTNADGTPATQAGSHPFALTTSFKVNATGSFEVEGEKYPSLDGEINDLDVEQIAGLVGDSTAIARCPTADFAVSYPGTTRPECPANTAVGVTGNNVIEGNVWWMQSAVYNLVPPPGVTARLGFSVFGVRVTIDVIVKKDPESNLIARVHETPQVVRVFATKLQLWGVPADPAHDTLRGDCAANSFIFIFSGEFQFRPNTEKTCSANTSEKPFITLPRSCDGPAPTNYTVDSWQNPAALLPDGYPDLSDPRWLQGSSLSPDDSVPPSPQGFTGCGKLNFDPTISAQPTTKAAQSPTGLDFSLDVENSGLTSASGLSNADVRKAVVTLPEGFTVNPSIAEGLNVCSEADLARETVNSAPGEGCPEASKIGTVEVDSPLVEEPVRGALYQATQNENPFHSLIALYMVIKNPNLGIIVKQPLKVETDASTGQITTVAENLPQLPFSHFKLHFREGARSPLASPPTCGSHDVTATLTPSSGGEPVVTHSAFEIISGPDNSACPNGGTPPFHPGLDAGTINNAAGGYSPFNVRLTRSDSEQEFTHFSIKLPPGISGKLAGIPFCSNAAIEAARGRTGRAELADPSCPAASEVGSTLVGAGVGSALTYVPGKVYLAGPYHGSALSIAAITSAVVGPFDIGTVVVRDALKINPETAEVFVDATGSDPIPHIIDGIPVHARDIRVYVNRPEFVLNPTSCKRTSTASTVLGSGTDFASEADDQPITVTSPFQAASCASLGFGPKLALSLKGGTRRGGTPQLKAVVTAQKGESNIGFAQVTLPHSEFLEQAHIKTICTRVQFAQGDKPGEACPPGSVYGQARATTPLLDEPIEGPVFLRSSSHNLPDLVAALHSGRININLVGRIDSVNGGRIRNTFESVPDAPVSRFVLEMQGGKKGLLVNSTNLCKAQNHAVSHFVGQNGKVFDTRPVLKAPCRKGRRAAGKKKSKH